MKFGMLRLVFEHANILLGAFNILVFKYANMLMLSPSLSLSYIHHTFNQLIIIYYLFIITLAEMIKTTVWVF